VLAVIEQSFFVAAQHLDDLLHRLQAASHRVVRPGFEEAFGSALLTVAPELAEVFLDAPGPTCVRTVAVTAMGPDTEAACAT
jgi:hypothetical protein